MILPGCTASAVTGRVTLGDAFDRSAQVNSARVAVVDGGRRVTYGELSGLVNGLALHLAEREISGGARVVFQLPNVLEYLAANSSRCYFHSGGDAYVMHSMRIAN